MNLMAGARGAAGLGCGTVGGRRCSRCRCCRRAAALEVGGVPARALELETRRGDLLVQRGLAAMRTDGQRGIGHFLQRVQGVAAGITFVSIDRHGGNLVKIGAPGKSAFQIQNTRLKWGQTGAGQWRHYKNAPPVGAAAATQPRPYLSLSTVGGAMLAGAMPGGASAGGVNCGRRGATPGKPKAPT